MGRESVTVQLTNGRSVEIRIDRSLPVTLYGQLFEQLKHFIGTRRIEQGQALPPIRTLGRLLHLSPVTVSRAFEELRARGLVESRQGRSVRVVDFRNGAAIPGGLVESRLKNFAETIATQARTLGYDPIEVARVLLEQGRSESQRDSHLLLVIDEFDSVDAYAEMLRSALVAEGIEVVGIRLDQLAANTELTRTAGIIASSPHCFGLVRQALPDRADEIVGLTMRLDPKVRDALSRIPPDSRVAVVATDPAFQPWMTYILRLQVPLHNDPLEAAMTDMPRVSDVIDRADVVVYGSGLRKRLPSMLPPNKLAIEMLHLPDARSIDNLRRHVLESEARTATAGNVA